MPELSPPAALSAREPAAPGWRGEVARRFWKLQWLKVLGTTAFVWLFFIAYFHLLRHPAHAVTTMPLTWIDRAVPFTPEALPLYLSLWFYVGIAPGLMPDLRRLLIYGLWAAALCTAGLALFWLWPTAVPERAPEVVQHPWLAVLQGVDAAGNACPSMHVAAAMFSCLRLHVVLRDLQVPAGWRWANAAWFAGIAWSTLAVRQHVALDAVAGAALGIVFALPALLARRPPSYDAAEGVSAGRRATMEPR